MFPVVAEKLCNTNVLCDVSLSAGGLFFQAHKLVLSICSAYFQVPLTSALHPHISSPYLHISSPYLHISSPLLHQLSTVTSAFYTNISTVTLTSALSPSNQLSNAHNFSHHNISSLTLPSALQPQISSTLTSALSLTRQFSNLPVPPALLPSNKLHHPHVSSLPSHQLSTFIPDLPTSYPHLRQRRLLHSHFWRVWVPMHESTGEIIRIRVRTVPLTVSELLVK